MPKLKNHSGSKKRFKVTASGKVKAQAAGKRHGMSKRPQKMKRNARGTFVMFKADGEKVLENFLRVV
ncbi:50S ribosomal protein L35 [Oleisolibacter albus]|uniref:50S ribosomal protein L35 n=1 Tax=Oleisolibacter albus TaxID=2171757 RepID=UPI000DF20D42|nr:50S ribosomal protein L35 [Oleisolibacter albus]